MDRNEALIGQLRKAGRTISVVEGEGWAVGRGGQRRLIATTSATLMSVRDRDGVRD